MSRKLKKSAKKEIREALTVYMTSGLPEHKVLDMMVDSVIKLLENPERVEEMYVDGYTHDDLVNDNT